MLMMEVGSDDKLDVWPASPEFSLVLAFLISLRGAGAGYDAIRPALPSEHSPLTRMYI